MARKVPIQMHVGNVLTLLGTLYRTPADALKEYVSNALDEWQRLRALGRGPEVCEVTYDIGRERIVILCNTPGMGRKRFEETLQRVADSIKRALDVRQIGRLGIGLWAFLQVGRRSVIRSREAGADETLRVVLREGREEAEFERAAKRDALAVPAFEISIDGLRFNPLKSRGPLAPERLMALLSEKFAVYLRDGGLRIVLRFPGQAPLEVPPPRISLPRLAEGLSPWNAGKGDRQTIGLDLHLDAGGKGRVGIRHSGVVVVEDLGTIEAYGFTESVYASGFVTGALDADFLTPLPARTGFEENEAWTAFVEALDRLRPTLEGQVEELKAQEKERHAAHLHEEALRLAREILDRTDFRDLELPQGMGRKSVPGPARAATSREPKEAGPREPPREPGERPGGGPRFNLLERAFEEGGRRHSRLVRGQIEVNTLNPDYRREFAGPEATRVAYESLLVGKEVVAFNDRSGAADEALERMLTFIFALKYQTRGAAVPVGKRPRGRPPSARAEESSGAGGSPAP